MSVARPSKGTLMGTSTRDDDATIADPFTDELGPYVAEAQQSPAFRTAFEDASDLQRVLDTLVRVRKQSGLSQTEVATRMGVRQPTVSGFENESSDPRFSTLQRYARAVGVRIRVVVDAPSSCDWVPTTPSVYREEAIASRRAVLRPTGSLAKHWPQRLSTVMAGKETA